MMVGSLRADLTDVNAVSPVKDPALMFVLSRLQDMQSRLVRLHKGQHKLADRILGALPDPVSGNDKSPQSDGMISMLHAVIDDLHRRITDCEEDMQRLSAL